MADKLNLEIVARTVRREVVTWFEQVRIVLVVLDEVSEEALLSLSCLIRLPHLDHYVSVRLACVDVDIPHYSILPEARRHHIYLVEFPFPPFFCELCCLYRIIARPTRCEPRLAFIVTETSEARRVVSIALTSLPFTGRVPWVQATRLALPLEGDGGEALMFRPMEMGVDEELEDRGAEDDVGPYRSDDERDSWEDDLLIVDVIIEGEVLEAALAGGGVVGDPSP